MENYGMKLTFPKHWHGWILFPLFLLAWIMANTIGKVVNHFMNYIMKEYP